MVVYREEKYIKNIPNAKCNTILYKKRFVICCYRKGAVRIYRFLLFFFFEKKNEVDINILTYLGMIL